jgi:hypothetical protein
MPFCILTTSYLEGAKAKIRSSRALFGDVLQWVEFDACGCWLIFKLLQGLKVDAKDVALASVKAVSGQTSRSRLKFVTELGRCRKAA